MVGSEEHPITLIRINDIDMHREYILERCHCRKITSIRLNGTALAAVQGAYEEQAMWALRVCVGYSFATVTFSAISAIGIVPANSYAGEFRNWAIERDINPNSSFPTDYIEQLRSTKDRCEKLEDLHSVPVRINHFTKESSTFTYYFQYHQIDPGKPTIVFLPGGPGSGSIGSVWPTDQFNLLLIDPRGVGCNYGRDTEFPLETMRTSQAVFDLVAVLNTMRLKNYVIYGQSYGTAVATELASQVAKNLAFPPKAVILEGTIGRAFPEPDSYASGFAYVANDFLNSNPDLKKMFSSHPLPLGLSAAFWGKYLVLAHDDWSDRLAKLLLLNNYLSGADSNSNIAVFFHSEFAKYTASLAATPRVPEESPGDYVLYTIGCREISGQECGHVYEYNLREGKVTTLKKDRLFSPLKYQGISLRDPFDSSKYPIAYPIYYFQGTDDPATNIEGAKYHYLMQTRSSARASGGRPVVFQTFLHKSHTPLTDLMFSNRNCWTNAFAEIFELSNDLSSVFTPDGECK